MDFPASFGKWTALGEDGTRKYYWLCRCECGNERPVHRSSLLAHATKSCGCSRRKPPLPRDGFLTCASCGTKKPDGEFHRDASSRTGFRASCNACRSEYSSARYATDPERFIAKAKERYEANREPILEALRMKRAADPELHRGSYRAWAILNREHLNARQQEWRLANPEKTRVAVRAWQRAHPVAVRTNGLRRKQRLHGVERTLTDAEWLEIVESFNGRCAYCGVEPGKITMDHMQSLKDGGPHTAANVVPACGSCNSAKKAHGVLHMVNRAWRGAAIARP